MFRSFLYIFLLLDLSFAASASGFPWILDPTEIDPKKGYELYLSGKTVRFLKEDTNRYSGEVGLQIQHLFVDIHMDYTYDLYEDAHYFRPYELALKLKRPDGSWTLGRKHFVWDEADLFWNRHLWQPIYADDTLRPKTAGLTGLFRNFTTKEGSTTLFVSLVYLPDFTPPFKNENGAITSKNPWFTPPPSRKIEPTNAFPYYIVYQPDLKDFVKPSIAAHTSYKGFHLAYAYKPLNRIKIKAPIIFHLSKPLVGNEKKGYEVDIPIKSVLLQHHILSGGLVLELPNQESSRNINYRLRTNFTYNHPEDHKLERPTDIFFQPIKEWHVSARGEIHVKDPLEETILHLAYTHQFQLEDFSSTFTKNLESGDAFETSFPEIEKQFFKGDLFYFSRAASTGISHNIKFSRGESAQINSRLIYHFLNKYFLFSFYSAYTFENNLSFFLSGDILFSNFPFSIDQTQEDIGIYTNKSRAIGGIKYVF